jgi:hypothetical protein
MTDEKIVKCFLEKNFDLIIEDKITIYDKIRQITLNENEFRKLIYTIFDDYWVKDPNDAPIEYAAMWYYEKKRTIMLKVDEFLSKCSVRLGLTEWILIGPNGEQLTEKSLLKNFTNFNTDFMLWYLESWKTEKMIEMSSKIMGY